MTVDVLLPTCDRPGPLAAVLTALLAQGTPLRVVLADQTAGAPSYDGPLVAGVVRVLEQAGVEVERHWRPERRGVAEQRAFLLSRARAGRVLCLDDDVLLGPGAVAVLDDALTVLGCGFVGMAFTGLSHLASVRPDDLAAFEPWDGPVLPERLVKDGPGWDRWKLHNAASPTHLAARVPADRPWLAYKVAWVPGCVLFDTAVLRGVGGFDFWRQLGEHGYGEDVAVRLRVMAARGGCGLLPTRAHHLEVETTLPVRLVDGYEAVFGPAS